MYLYGLFSQFSDFESFWISWQKYFMNHISIWLEISRSCSWHIKGYIEWSRWSYLYFLKIFFLYHYLLKNCYYILWKVQEPGWREKYFMTSNFGSMHSAICVDLICEILECFNNYLSSYLWQRICKKLHYFQRNPLPWRQGSVFFQIFIIFLFEIMCLFN